MTLEDNISSGGADSPAAMPASVNPDLINKPMLPLRWLYFFGTSNWNRQVQNAITYRSESVRYILNRPLTQNELDAITTHTSTSLKWSRSGLGLGAVGWTLQTMKNVQASREFKSHFPPGRPVTPSALFDLARIYVFVDPSQSWARVSRSLFVGSFWLFGGWFLTDLFARSQETLDSRTDPRLKEFVDALRGQTPEAVKQKAIQARRFAVQKQYEQSQREKLGSDAVLEVPGEDYQQQQSPAFEQSAQSSRPQQQAPDSYQQSPSNTSFFESDDASPTASEYRNEDLAPPVSAWERIRQQNAPPAKGQQAQVYTQEQPGKGSSWDNYASDKQREKERAQAEFDRIMEKERNFNQQGNQDGGSGKGWGSW